MKVLRYLCLLIAIIILSLSAQAQTSAPDGSRYQWVLVADGFNVPLLVTHGGDGSGRLFVVEQDGYIFVLQSDGSYDDFDPFLDVSGLLSNDVFQGGYTERGLLGLAFHPEFETNGIFFINHTDKNGDTIIARYHVNPDDPNHADPASRAEILMIRQPFYDHNGGHLAFGPDDYLYISVGDGGSLGDDPGLNAQNLAVMLGKLLRIDINADTYAVPPDNPFVGVEQVHPEIWAYGLRNPWRFSFDRLTGDLYIGDVGQERYEEIDFQPAGDPGGENYGWYNYEGLHPYKDRLPPENMTIPITEYAHDVGCSVTGGYVYRGESLPELHGFYFFGDYCSGRIWSLFRDSEGKWHPRPFMETGRVISSFGEDEAGELYLVDYKGEVLRLASVE